MFFEAPLVIYDDAALAVIRSLAIGLGLLQVPLMWWFVRVLQAVFRVVASSGDAVSVASSAFSASA